MARSALLAVSTAISIALLTNGCAGPEDDADRTSSGPSSELSTTDAASPSTEVALPTSDNIDIGGVAVYVRCWGERRPDEPSVLLMSGHNLDTGSWENMATEFAAEGHHLCAYDRVGAGLSDYPLEPARTTADQIADVVALLDAVELQEPLVVVAHSIGALTAVGLVDEAPERVAGVVLVDPLSPGLSAVQRAALPAKQPDEAATIKEERRFLFGFLEDPAQNGEHLLLFENDEHVARLLDQPGPVFGDLPVVVLQAPRLPPFEGLPPELLQRRRDRRRRRRGAVRRRVDARQARPCRPHRPQHPGRPAGGRHGRDPRSHGRVGAEGERTIFPRSLDRRRRDSPDRWLRRRRRR